MSREWCKQRETVQRLTRAAENDHQQVVELVCNSRRKLAYTLQFLVLQMDRLGLLLTLDFRAGPEPVRDLAGVVAEWDRTHQVPSEAAVRRAPQPVLYLKYRPGLSRLRPGTQCPFPVFGMQKLIPPRRARLFHALPGVFQPLAVRVLGASVRVYHPDHLRNGVQQVLVLSCTASTADFCSSMRCSI